MLYVSPNGEQDPKPLNLQGGDLPAVLCQHKIQEFHLAGERMGIQADATGGTCSLYYHEGFFTGFVPPPHISAGVFTPQLKLERQGKGGGLRWRWKGTGGMDTP